MWQLHYNYIGKGFRAKRTNINRWITNVNKLVKCLWIFIVFVYSLQLSSGSEIFPNKKLSNKWNKSYTYRVDDKEFSCNTRDPASIPGSWISPEEGDGNSLSVPAWRIPWTEEPGGLLSMKLQRVGQDWVISHTHTHYS